MRICVQPNRRTADQKIEHTNKKKSIDYNWYRCLLPREGYATTVTTRRARSLLRPLRRARSSLPPLSYADGRLDACVAHLLVRPPNSNYSVTRIQPASQTPVSYGNLHFHNRETPPLSYNGDRGHCYSICCMQRLMRFLCDREKGINHDLADFFLPDIPYPRIRKTRVMR